MIFINVNGSSVGGNEWLSRARKSLEEGPDVGDALAER
jgi:hypothetical protein